MIKQQWSDFREYYRKNWDLGTLIFLSGWGVTQSVVWTIWPRFGVNSTEWLVYGFLFSVIWLLAQNLQAKRTKARHLLTRIYAIEELVENYRSSLASVTTENRDLLDKLDRKYDE